MTKLNVGIQNMAFKVKGRGKVTPTDFLRDCLRVLAGMLQNSTQICSFTRYSFLGPL